MTFNLRTEIPKLRTKIPKLRIKVPKLRTTLAELRSKIPKLCTEFPTLMYLTFNELKMYNFFPMWENFNESKNELFCPLCSSIIHTVPSSCLFTFFKGRHFFSALMCKSAFLFDGKIDYKAIQIKLFTLTSANWKWKERKES